MMDALREGKGRKFKGLAGLKRGDLKSRSRVLPCSFTGGVLGHCLPDLGLHSISSAPSSSICGPG